MYIGIILHTLAKCAFIAGSYIIHFFLGKYLPATEYGIVGTIITIINFEYLLLNNGVRQAISNAISQEKYDNKNITAGFNYIKSLRTIFDLLDRK